jgi:hypothetical protein
MLLCYVNITKYSEHEDIEKGLSTGEPMLAVISFDGRYAYIGHIDECLEHHILLAKVGHRSDDIDKYFRIIFAHGEACNWTFIVPPNYRNITNKETRVSSFYRDGHETISQFLTQLNMQLDIRIPTRYRRHLTPI